MSNYFHRRHRSRVVLMICLIIGISVLGVVVRIELLNSPCGLERVRQLGGTYNIRDDGGIEVDLSGCYRTRAEDLHCLQQVSNLCELDISNTNIKGSDLEWLGNKTSLTSLKASGCSQLSGISGFVNRNPQLNHVIISHSNLTQDDTLALANLPGLEMLAIEYSRPPISDQACNAFGRISNLKELYLSGNNISDAGCLELASLNKLRILSLNENPITEQSFKVFERLPNLQKLSIFDTAVRSVHFEPSSGLTDFAISADSLTEKDIFEITQISSLRVLHLDVCGLSENIAEHIQVMPNLVHLHLDGVTLSEDELTTIASNKALVLIWLEKAPAVSEACRRELGGKVLVLEEMR